MGMRKVLFALLLLLLCPLATTAHQLYAITNTTANGYNFWLYVPASYKDYRVERQQNVEKKLPESLPIVVFLHGRSLSGTDLTKVRKYGTLDALHAGRKINAIVIAPQVKSGDWWRPNRVMSLINWVADNYDVDTSRIYVLGMSLGGYGALDFAAAYPKETAAAMAFCGGSTRKPADLARLNEVPLWIMHGTADNLVPVSESRRVQKAMKEANSDTPRLRYDEFVGAGHSLYARTFYTGEAYEWLFKHSTNDTMRPVDRTVQIPHSRLSNQPYRGLKFRSVPLNVVQKSVAVPETSKLKHTRSVPQKKAEMAAGNYHTIAAGDTLTKLAKMYNTTIKQLCEWNNITETSILKIGQKIVVKGENSKHKYHTIVAGDTLSGLAVKYNTTVKQICQWNNITENTILQLNKKLRVK